MQRDHRLAGARAARDRDHALGGRADRLVLLGLDGRHDRVHRAVAGPGELGHQRTLADDRQVGLGLGVEQVVLDAEHLLADAAQDPAAYDAPRLGVRRLVEHRGGRRPPVDEQHVAVVVAQPDPADVARRRVDLAAHVEPAEDQALVRGVERRQPAGRLEHHRVALDQPALVAEPAPRVALLGQRLGGCRRADELAVDAVHELLLARYLARRGVLVQAPQTPSRSPSGWSPCPTKRQVHKPTRPQATVGADFRRRAAGGQPAVRRSRSSRCRARCRRWCGSSSSRCRRPGSA